MILVIALIAMTVAFLVLLWWCACMDNAMAETKCKLFNLEYDISELRYHCGVDRLPYAKPCSCDPKQHLFWHEERGWYTDYHSPCEKNTITNKCGPECKICRNMRMTAAMFVVADCNKTPDPDVIPLTRAESDNANK